MSLPASVETTLIVPATLIMKLAMVSSHFPMEPTMPTIVAIAKSIVEAIVPTVYPIVHPIMSAFSLSVVVTVSMLRVEG